MVRKLALAVSLALGTLSVPVHALGLGELSSKSTLNQNFDGNITLLSVKAEELDGVRVRLADNEAFKRAGIERPFYLTLLKFEPSLSSRGKSVIRVSSDFPIREPFLNFLIEVDWPNGRMLREFTVLLDPPTTTKRRPPKVKPAVKARQAVPAKARPVTPTRSTAMTSAAPAVSTDGSEYGPVRANETAWSISKKVRPVGVSMAQMMIALLDANPQAFIDGNINRLRKGQILRVPALSEIQKLNRQQAGQAYREQQDRWLARRNEKLQSEAAASEAATESAADGEAGSDSGAADTKDQLRIATARPEGEGEAGAGDDDAQSTQASDIKSRLIVARENAETSRQEAETLRSHVDDLQLRLEDMQKLLSLKDEQLAQLQDRAATEGLAEEESIAAAEPEMVPQDDEAAVEPAEQEALAATAETATVPDAEEPQPATTVEYRIQDIPPQIDPDLIVEAGVAEAVPQTAGEAAAEEISPPTGEEEQGIADIAPQIDPDLIVTGAVDAGPVDEVIDVQDAPGVEAVVAEEAAGAEILVGEDAAVDELVVELEQPLETQAVEEAVVVDSVETAVSEPQPTEPVKVEPVTAPEVVVDTTTEPQTKPEASESFIPKPLASMLEKNMLPIGAGAAVLLGLFGWLSLRGRRKDKDEADEVLQPEAAVGAVSAADAVEPLSAVDEPALDSEALSDLPDSSFLDEFSPSEINTLQDETGEVDPVSEADVYIAYGRYQQAEEMLRQAMNRDPDRLALKHKLLEVHYATRNVDGFCVLAQEMVDAGQDSADESAWARAQDMGRELSPENALFALREGEDGIDLTDVEVAVADAADATIDEDTLALDDLELSELTADFDEEKIPAEDLEAPSEVSIMLDLDEPAEPERSEPELPEAIQLDEIAGLDFELPEADSGVKAESGDEANDTMPDSMNLDSMLAQAEAAVDAEDSNLNLESEFSADELQAQLDELSDLAELDSELDKPPQAETVEPPASLGLVEEDGGLSLAGGLDQPLNLDTAFDATAADDGASAEVLELEAFDAPSEPVGEDEVATKLDLARAYVEMGDEDGARSILEEVVVEGNPTQRTDAEALLGQLG